MIHAAFDGLVNELLFGVTSYGTYYWLLLALFVYVLSYFLGRSVPIKHGHVAIHEHQRERIVSFALHFSLDKVNSLLSVDR